MLRRLIACWGWLVLALGAVSGSSLASPVQPAAEPAARFEMAARVRQPPQLASLAGNPLLLRRDRQDQLLLERLSDGEPQRIGPATLGGKISAPRLAVRQGVVYAAWQERLAQTREGLGRANEEVMLLRASRDGGVTFEPVRRLTRQGIAMPVAELAVSAPGDLYVLSLEQTKAGSELYVDRGREGGRDWGAGQRINAPSEGRGRIRNPRVLAQGESAWIVWWESTKDKKASIKLARSEDRGESWSGPDTIHLVPNPAASTPMGLQLIRSGERLLLYWWEVGGIQGLVSVDEGRHWEALKALPGAGPGLRGFAAQADAQGMVHLIYTEEKAPGQRPEVYYARSETGVSFSPPVRLSTDHPPYMGTSDLPALAVDEQAGQVLVVWQDLRRFRPAIYGNVSLDGGKTWRSRDFVLGAAPGEHIAMYPTLTALGEGKFLAAWVEYPNIRLAQPEAVVWSVIPSALPETVAAEPDLDRLTKRVEEYWETRLAGNWAKVYDYLDPFYRNRSTREGYAYTHNKVRYYGYAIKDLQAITPRRVRVSLSYEYEVPKLLVGGQPRSVPRKEDETTQEWIWVDGDWFLVYKDVFGQGAVAY